MATELILIKRKAREGEIGLFVDSPVFDEEWSSLPMGQDIKAECTVPYNIRYLKFFWALVSKVLDNTPEWRFLDKEDAKQHLLLEARHYKPVYDERTGKCELRAKSVAGLSADTWLRLLKRCTHVVITKYLPGMEENVLKAEIRDMLGMDIFNDGHGVR